MRKFSFAFILGALLLPGAGFTVGLGEIEVSSALNQELDAEIALLSATPADAEQMIVKLASGDEFNRAGIDRPYLLTSLRFKTFDKDGQPYIKVTSPRPIREPFLNFLVEIDWPQGHLLREYTILLDPPVFMGADETATPARPARQETSRPAESAATAAPASSRPAAWTPPAQSAPQPAASAPTSVAPAAVADSQVAYSRPAYAPSDGHRVQQGDTAWSLASQMRPDDSVTVEQMMIAMLRTNPEVFINGNVNGLKRGYILRMPDRAAMGAVDHNEAVALVKEQNALWRQYQAELAGGAPASSIATDASGTTAGSVDDAGDSRLNIVSAGSGAGMSSGDKDPTGMSAEELRARLALTNEQLETERLEKEALNGKVERLEGQVDKMKKMLTIEDQDMARMQASQQPTDEPVADTPADMAADMTADSEQAVADEMPAAGEEMVTEGDMPVADSADSDAAAAPEEAADAGEQDAADQPAGEQIFVDETTADASEPVAQPDTSREFLDTMPADFITPERQDPIDVIMNNPIVLGVIAFGVLLLGGLVAFFVRRGKKNKADAAAAPAPLPVDDDLEDVADMIDDDALTDVVSDEQVEESMAEAEAEAEEEFDAASTMILPAAEDTVISSAEDLQEEPEEDRDDVIAEADVYLAYGIYQQAEELLNNAISEHPDRDSYRVKLAETHYASKNADAFVSAASGLKDTSGTDTKAWAKVAAMGKDLCPDNDMFQASDMTGGVDLDDLMPKAPEMDIDLEGDAGDDAAAAPDLDFSLDDESPLDLPDATDDSAALDLDAGEPELATPAVDELEFDLSDTDAVEEKTDEEDEFSLDIDAGELDLGDDAEAATDEVEIDLTADMESTAIMDLDEVAADLGDAPAEEIDLDLGLDDAVEEVAEEAVEAATDEIDLDLGLDDAADSVEDAGDAAVDLGVDMSDELDDDLGDLGDVDEVGTKLDLARAYLDMGDAEGTRSILDEVMAEGSDEQKKEAEEILSQL